MDGRTDVMDGRTDGHGLTDGWMDVVDFIVHKTYSLN